MSSRGRDYLRSRDIDLGFHLDVNWSDEEYGRSGLRRTIDKIQSLGFEQVSFRFMKHFSQQGKELTQDQARKLPVYEIFDLYVEILVDTGDACRHSIVRFSIAERIAGEIQGAFDNMN